MADGRTTPPVDRRGAMAPLACSVAGAIVTNGAIAAAAPLPSLDLASRLKRVKAGVLEPVAARERAARRRAQLFPGSARSFAEAVLEVGR